MFELMARGDNQVPTNGSIMNGADPPFWLLFGQKGQLLAVLTTPSHKLQSFLQTYIIILYKYTRSYNNIGVISTRITVTYSKSL